MQSILHWMNILAIVIVCLCEGALVIDWLQTRTIAKNPGQFHEAVSAPILGAHPSLGVVNAWFGFWVVGTALLAAIAPMYAPAFPGEVPARLLVGMAYLLFVWRYELPCIKGNKRAGIWLDVPWR